MSGSQGRKMDDKRSALGRVWRTLGEEKVVQMPTANGLQLAHHEERYSRICEKNATTAKYRPI